MRKPIGVAIAFFIAGNLPAAQIIGLVTQDVAFSSQSAAVSFSAIGPGQSTTTTPGTITGSNYTVNTQLATATNFTTQISDLVQLNVTAGPATDIFGITAEAWSGAVRVTNAGASAASYSFNQTMFYSLQTIGPTTAFLSMFAYLERFNAGTNDWDIIGSTSFGITVDQFNNACKPCVGSSSYSIGANSTADVRIHAQLRGSLYQAAGSGGASTPEPASFALMAAGLIGAFAYRRIQR